MEEYDVIIIGAGPAGMTAAIYASRANLKTLILEKDTPGGQLVKTKVLKNYPGFKSIDGPTLAYQIYEQVNELNVIFNFEEVIEMKVTEEYKLIKTNLSNEYKSKNVIIATGTSYKNLAVVGERKFIGKGISYCAVCDGKLFQDKDILVIGNTNTALKETLYLAKFAKKIYMITNENVFDETSLYFNDVKNNNKIEMFNNVKLVKINGDTSLNGVEIKNLITEEIITLKVEGIFPFIGSTPSTSFLSSFDVFNSNGYMNVNEHFESKIKGLYGVGDVIDKKLRQVVTACSDGAIAAQHIADKNK